MYKSSYGSFSPSDSAPSALEGWGGAVYCPVSFIDTVFPKKNFFRVYKIAYGKGGRGGGEQSASSTSTPLTRPPFILHLRLHPLGGREQCRNVNLLHCSPTPPVQ